MLTLHADRVELFTPLLKFDERTGEFTAWSSVEEVDSHKEICDIEASWPAILADGKQQFEISGGKSVGVLRRQHRRDTSIGKLTLIERRDREGVPGVWIEGLCTDEQAKEDAATGVLTGVSIRGLASRWPDPERAGVMRYAWTLREEDSLVDRPAVPHALIEVMKSDGGIQMVKAAGRQPAQFWDCGNAACPQHCKHSKKEEAMKCDESPSRIEATKASDTAKSLWTVADLVALLSTLLCITDDAEWNATWEALDAQREGEAPDGGSTAIVNQLKTIAQSLFDALQAMIAEDRRELDESVAAGVPDTATTDPLAEEMAMSFAMRALATSPTARQLIKSLRVQSSNGSNEPKEGIMPKTKEQEKAEAATVDAATIQKAIDDLAAQITAITARLDKIEADEAAEDATVTADTSKGLAGLATQIEALAKRLDTAPKPDAQIDELKKSVAQLGEGFETLVAALPTRRQGVLRPVSKESETVDAKKEGDGATKTGNPFVDLVERVF